MPTAYSRACPLTIIAWRLSDLTLTDLWWRYVSLGGQRPGSTMATYLDGTAAWPAAAHNVLAQTLNEGLWELGIPSLAPLRGPEHVPDGPAAHTGHGQPEAPDRRP